MAVSTVFADGGAGGLDLARKAVAAAEKRLQATPQFLYPLEMSIKDKIGTIAARIYGADGVRLHRSRQ